MESTCYSEFFSLLDMKFDDEKRVLQIVKNAKDARRASIHKEIEPYEKKISAQSEEIEALKRKLESETKNRKDAQAKLQRAREMFHEQFKIGLQKELDGILNLCLLYESVLQPTELVDDNVDELQRFDANLNEIEITTELLEPIAELDTTCSEELPVPAVAENFWALETIEEDSAFANPVEPCEFGIACFEE